MNKLIALPAAAFLLGASSLACALPLNVTDTINIDKHLSPIVDYTSWTHEFEFAPPAETILSAGLTLTFWDDDKDYTIFGVCLSCEYGLGIGEDLTWDFGEIDTGSYEYDISISAVEDGSYSVWLKSAGDYYFESSVLSIDYLPVPEPGTLALLGLGLAGLGAARRRKA